MEVRERHRSAVWRMRTMGWLYGFVVWLSFGSGFDRIDSIEQLIGVIHRIHSAA